MLILLVCNIEISTRVLSCLMTYCELQGFHTMMVALMVWYSNIN